MRIPEFLPQKGWSIHTKGYVIYTSRATRPETNKGLKRGKSLHVAIAEHQLGRPLEDGEVVHHQNFNKRCACDFNFVIMPACFNPSGAMRDPYTGEFLSRDGYLRRYGNSAEVPF